jgi:hypothetical protein
MGKFDGVFLFKISDLIEKNTVTSLATDVTVWSRAGGGNGRETVRNAVITKARPSERLRRVSSEFTFTSLTYRRFRKRYRKLPKGLNYSHSMVPGGFDVTS